MAQINFYPRTDKKNKAGESPIVMFVTFNNEKFKVSTGQKCQTKHWHEGHQKVKPNTKAEPDNNHPIINMVLEGFRKKAQDIINYATLNEINLNKKYFGEEWAKAHNKSAKGKTLIEYFEIYIEVQKPLKAERTIKGHITALNILKEFASQKGISMNLEKIDYDFFESFRDYAFREMGYSNNYFSTLIKRLKTVMNWALIKGYHKNAKFKNFSAPEKPKEIVCLYEDELFKIYNHDFTKKKRLERVRDVYCFGCFTGLRFSDIIDLKREHLAEDEIQKVIVKTKEFQRIPLNKYALEILDKYKDQASPLPHISHQKFNSYVKDVCKEAEINTMVSVTTYSGGTKTQRTLPKWQLMTSHTARKTFTTNSLIFGMNESVVKKITGHKKDDNFKRYVRLAESHIKEQAKSAWNRNRP